ncbi:TPA: alpha/beta hydrolase, partial [Acinetobacter baumannii]|nr:alpha/beta hydrolase [Acinetobacter baumannii]
IDVTEITGELSGAQVAGATVAAAAILIPLSIKVFKYIRSAF